jgi:RNA 2',3'-cyclic 3'-phosphodiesterase
MHRLFVAIRPPAPVRDQLLGLMEGAHGARWQGDDQLHLTLRYIGNVNHLDAEDIAQMLAMIRAAPFTIALSGVGSFETRGRIDSLWAGVTPKAPLAQLHNKIDHLVANITGAHEQRAYMPHITLARFGRDQRGIADFIASHAGLISAPFAVADFALFKSHIEVGGPRYEAIADYQLG